MVNVEFDMMTPAKRSITSLSDTNGEMSAFTGDGVDKYF